MQIEPKLLTISQAAHFLGISKDTLRRWEKSGLISPSRTAGGLRRYSWEDLRVTRFQTGRRLYRMNELLQSFKSNRQTVKTIVLTSLVWAAAIALYALLKPAFLSPTNPEQQILSEEVKSQNHLNPPSALNSQIKTVTILVLPNQQKQTPEVSSSTPGVGLVSDLLIRQPYDKPTLQYTNTPGQYFLLEPLDKNQISTLIKRN